MIDRSYKLVNEMRALLLAVTVVHCAALAQDNGAVGYPSVAAALASLKEKTNVRISNPGGWTIVEDDSVIWSFTPPGHPAHPAVVKRAVVARDGGTAVETSALCQASKSACDRLMEEFKQLDQRMKEALDDASPDASGAVSRARSDTGWHPTAEQKQRVESQSRAWFEAKDARRYDEAYQQLSAVQKQMFPFERWRSLSDDLNAKLGAIHSRVIKKITWYKNPAQAAPGIYAAVDFAAKATNANIYCGYVVWVEQPDGSFMVLREEQNLIDKTTEQKLKPQELEKARAQLRCSG